MRNALLPLLLLAVALPARAVSPKDVMPARSMGLGGSRGGASGNDAIFLNPAALGATTHYTAQLDYLHSTAPSGVDDGGDAIIVSVGDSISNPNFPSGLAYRYMALGPGGDNAKGWITDFAIAVPLTANFSLGTRVTYLSYTQGGRDLSRFTGDFGGLLKLDILQLGIVGFNLIKVDSPSSARGMALSAALTDSLAWRIGGDLRWDWASENSTRSWSVGGEYLLGRALPVRAGFESDGVRQTRFWSVGSGIMFQQFGIDVTYRRDTVTGDGVWAFSGKLFGGG